MSCTVTKQFSFCYGHSLPDYDGKCKNVHGHNSVLEVEYEGSDTNTYSGMVLDFGDIKRTVEPVLELLDHKNLNELLPDEFQPPTAENITMFIVRVLQRTEHGKYLVRVRVSETPASWAEWKRNRS